MIVVDTNVIVGAYLHGPHAKEIDVLLERDREWFSPYLWRSEFRNVLALYLRKSVIGSTEASSIAQHAENRMRNGERWPVSARVLQLAQASGCTSYDCEFVSVAIDLDVPLVTLDKQVLKQFPLIATTPGKYSSK